MSADLVPWITLFYFGAFVGATVAALASHEKRWSAVWPWTIGIGLGVLIMLSQHLAWKP